MKSFARNLIQNLVSQEHNTIQHSTRKTIGCFEETIGCLYQLKITTTEFKEFKEERDAQTVYTGSLLNQELHPVS